MLATLSLPGTFFFYAGVALIGTIILYFVLPETEGRSLTEIEEHFSGGVPLNAKPNHSDEEKNGNASTTVAAVARPKADVLGMGDKTSIKTEPNKHQKIDLTKWNSDHAFQKHFGEKHEGIHGHPHHNHHPLYAQNPRAYMRHNNRSKVGDDNAAVFSTHL